MAQGTLAPKRSRPPGSLRRLSVADYHRMIASGVLTAADRVELLDGYIVEKTTQNPPHSAAITRWNRWLSRLLPETWCLRVQCPITLGTSEPEPDFALARRPEERYETRHPGPRDLALVVEIADSSLLEDRRHKGRLYAEARIPSFWLVNLVEGTMEIDAKPGGAREPRYRTHTVVRPGEDLDIVLGKEPIATVPLEQLLNIKS